MIIIAVAGLTKTSILFGQVQHELWGITASGGTNNDGVIFKTDASGNGEMVKSNFVPSGTNSTNPYGSLVLSSNGNLYGMTWYGGTNGEGTIFEYNPRTWTFLTKYEFSDMIGGRWPQGNGLIEVNGKLYGMTKYGGVNDYGVIFRYDVSNDNFVKMADFDMWIGVNPGGALVQASNGMFYGMTSRGGLNHLGVLFQFAPAGSSYSKKLDFNGTNGSNPRYTTLIEIPVNISTSPTDLINCIGASVAVPFTIEGAFDDGNVFTAQLSDALGSFASPVVIGSLTSPFAGTINAVIPKNTAHGMAYRIRVVGTLPAVTGSDNGTNIAVNALPDTSTTLHSPIITANLAGEAYQWVNCNSRYSIITGAIGQSYTATANGSYTVILTISGNGCVDTSSCVSVTNIGFDDLTASNLLSVNPNPTKGNIVITYTGKSTIEIINMNGKVELTYQYIGIPLSVDLEKLPCGTYIVRSINENET